MKISLSWLAELVDLPPTDALVERLTLSGFEVEAVERPGAALAGVVVAEVKSKNPHPQADRLSVTEVSTGAGNLRQVVCGAKNFRVGDRVPLAPPGTELPGGKRIEAASVRGVDSQGMLCSADELGLAGSVPVQAEPGLLLLAPDAPLGTPVMQALGLNDTLLEVNVTPNRPDALSHLGLAREVAVLTRKPLRWKAAEVAESSEEAGKAISVQVEDRAACPRFGTRVVEGVAIAPSPPWMQARLRGCGVRPINNVVDVTNYVMLELGHPLHAFDLDRLAGSRIVVRDARPGEKLRTLDGKERVLDAEDLVVADASAPQGLAGIMGGGASEVTEKTTRILLEAAYFQPGRVRRSAKRHGLNTEASHRFSRGADVFAIPRALDRAAALLLSLGTGRVQVRKGRVDVFDTLPAGKMIGLRYERLDQLLGVDISPDEAKETLTALGLQLDVGSDEQGLFSVPSFRVDLAREEDLIEEIARVHGYENLPAELPRGIAELTEEPPGLDAERRMRGALSGAGFDEVVNYSFVSPAQLQALGETAEPIVLSNPLSVEQSVLRTTLAAGLLQNLSEAVRHQAEGVRLYELGRVYFRNARTAKEESPSVEVARLAGLLWGQRDGRSWNTPRAEVDFFDAKGAVEALIQVLRIEGVRFVPLETSASLLFHPRACAEIRIGEGPSVGRLGELHPKVAHAVGLPRGIFLFELDLEPLYARAALRPKYHPLPRHPAVLRDLAVLVPLDLPEDQVRDAVREVGGAWVEDVVVFDQYTGAPVPAGKKNLAFALRYRVADRTLTDAEVSEAHERIVKAVGARFGGLLRGA